MSTGRWGQQLIAWEITNGGNSLGVTLWVQFSNYLILEIITQCQNDNDHLGFMLHTTLTKYVLQSMKNFNASNVNLQLH